MLRIGVQTKNAVNHEKPLEGLQMLKEAGFSCLDFSLNDYLRGQTLYAGQRNTFFDRTDEELAEYFRPFKEGAGTVGLNIHQMHMPYPVYIPDGPEKLNDYLKEVVAVKSLKLCAGLGCRYIVVHGFKLARYLGSEEAEWEMTEAFLDSLAPLAYRLGVTVCVENLYTSIGEHIVEGPCCDAWKAAERIDRMNERHGAEVLGFCFDTGHANLTGLDFESFLTTLGKRLKVLHIHDNDGLADLHQIPFTFTRTRENRPATDWEGFIRGLGAAGFDGALSFETAPVLDAFPGEMRRETLAFIAGVGRYFAGRLESAAGERQY